MKTSRIALHLAGRAAVGFGLGLATGIMKGSALLARKLSEEKKQKQNDCPKCNQIHNHTTKHQPGIREF